MRKLFVLTLVLLTVSLGACSAGTIVNGGRRGVVIAPNAPVQMFRQYIDVTIENVCGDVLKVFNGDSVPMMTLGYTSQYTVRLQRPILASDRSLNLPLSVQVFTKDGRFIGSALGRRYVNLRTDVNNTGRTEQWVVNRLEGIRCPGPSANTSE